jgi:hypothetical protein
VLYGFADDVAAELAKLGNKPERELESAAKYGRK